MQRRLGVRHWTDMQLVSRLTHTAHAALAVFLVAWVSALVLIVTIALTAALLICGGFVLTTDGAARAWQWFRCHKAV